MIIPVIDASVLENISIETQEILSKFNVLGEVMVSGAELASSSKYCSFLSDYALSICSFVDDLNDFSSETSLASIYQWLDLGSKRIVLSIQRELISDSEMLSAWIKNFPGVRNRLIINIEASDLGSDKEKIITFLTEIANILRSHVSTLQFSMNDCKISILEFASCVKSVHGKEGDSKFLELIFSNIKEPTEVLIGTLHQDYGIDVVAPCKIKGSYSFPSTSKQVDMAVAMFSCFRSDRIDGLIPTVVCDECHVALGLVYSNPESLSESLSNGRGVYWSRSRNGLWRKGDTSGAWQKLISIKVDCDSDALRFSVIQNGSPPAFCHLNRRNCWAEESGLGALERVLKARQVSAPPGSYTARLFSDPELLRNKLVEEAQELSEAQTPSEVASEAADLLYFAMVKCISAGVGISEVENWLDRRALKVNRRPGNSKQYRIDNANEILKKKDP